MVLFGKIAKGLKKQCSPLPKQSGNIFFALFGAVALVGAVGATATGIMSGPMKAMTKVSTRAVSENEIMANMRLAVMGISQPGVTKDCDMDGVVEPLAYKIIAGKTPPVGGGFIPDGISTSSLVDAWKTNYAYCVWDHGTLINSGGCSGGNRLPGLNKTTYPAGVVGQQTVLAIISAGPNRAFETRCETWAAADLNNDGDVADAGDKQLVNRPTTSDDLVMSYTYDEASLATSSNWGITNASLANATTCPAGYTLTNGKCYRFSASNLTWQAARNACKADGADLVTINDNAEWTAVYALTGVLNSWVGLNDITTEGAFAWPAGGTFSKWKTGEPNDSGGTEDCVFMEGASSGLFVDNVCTGTARSVCEMSGTGAGGAMPADIRSGLIAEYKFDEGAGTSVKDTTGAHNGTFVNTPTWVPRPGRGTALDFQGGDNDGVNVPGILGSPATSTISAWVNIPSTYGTSGASQIVSIGGREILYADASNVTGQWWNGASWRLTSAGPAITGQGWKHLVMVFDHAADKYRLYQNGVLTRTDTYTDPMSWSTPNNQMRFGQHAAGLTTYNLHGSLDDVRIYNRPLSTPEVTQLYNYYLSGGTDLAVKNDEKVEVTGNTTVSGGIMAGGLKLADQTNSGACNAANALALRTNSGTPPTILEICDWDGMTGTWESISGGGAPAPTGGPFVAVGQGGGGAATSPDGITWTPQTSSFGASIINGVTYGAGTFVAVGNNGKIATSPDGIVWTQQTSSFGGSDYIEAATYSNGVFVAVGGAGKIATSPNGINWTQQTSSFGGGDTIEGVTYGKGVFVAVGAGKIATSPNGINWTQQTSSFGGSGIDEVAYGGGRFVAVGSSGKIATSPDGITWTQQTSSFGGSEDIQTVAYGNGIFVAAAYSGLLATSPDGITWTQRTSSFGSSIIRAVTYGNGIFVAGGSSGKIATSPNGTSWTQQTPIGTNSYAIIYPSESSRGYASATLLGHWKLDESSGTAVASATGTNNGVWSGSASVDKVSGAVDGAFNFDGIDNVVTVLNPSSAANPKRLTIATWIYPRQYGNGGQSGILTQNMTSNTGYKLYMNEGAFGFTFNYYFSGVDGAFSAPYSLTLNQWNHIALSYDADNISAPPRFYLNGKPIPTQIFNQPTGAPTPGIQDIYIGNFSDNSRPFDGYIDDVRLYNGILSAQEIENIYQGGMSPVGVAWRERYTANQSVPQWRNAAHQGLSHGTNILLQSGIRGHEAGIGMRIDMVQADNEDITASVSGVRTGNYGQGGIVFRAHDYDNLTDSRVVMQDKSRLGVNVATTRALSAKVQINDRLDNVATGFNVAKPNCIAGKSDPLQRKAAYTGSGTAISSWTDGKYYYVADGATLRALRFDGTTLTQVGSYTGTDTKGITGDGTYLYLSDGTTGVRALTFNGTTFTLISTFNTPGTARSAFLQNGYLYVADWTSGVRVLSFNGTVFTDVANYDTPGSVETVWGDGTFIYAADIGTGLMAFRGAANFMLIAADTTVPNINGLTGDGAYIYTGSQLTEGFNAFTFDGLTFTKIATYATPVIHDMWSDGNYIYAGLGNDGLNVYSFDGTTVRLVKNVNPPGSVYGILGDGNYLMASVYSEGFALYTGFECTAYSSWDTGYQKGVLSNNYKPGIPAITEKFVSVGSAGLTATSPDGTTWTQTPGNPFGGEWTYDIIFANGQFVAAGSNGHLATSVDGLTWTPRTSSFAGTLIYGLAYGNGVYVAAGVGGKIASSPDGINWQQRTSSFAGTDIRGVAFGNGLFVAVGWNGKLATSSDGINWQQRTSSFGSTMIRGVAYGGTLWVAVGSSGKLATSSDGINWIQRTSSFGSDNIWDVEYNGSLWVAVATDGSLATSSNGTGWTQRTSSFGSTEIVGVGQGNGTWVIGGLSGKVASSTNGTSWTQRTSTFGSGEIYKIAWGADPAAAVSEIYSSVFVGAKGRGASQIASILYSANFQFIDTDATGASPFYLWNFGSTNMNTQVRVAQFHAPKNSYQDARNNSPTGAPNLRIQRHRGDGTTSYIVQNGDYLGGVLFTGYNGTATTTRGHAGIMARINGTVTTGSVPVDLHFGVSAAELASANTSMILTSGKYLGIGTATPTANLQVAGRIGAGEGLRIGSDSSCSGAGDDGVLRVSSNVLQYCNGTAWTPFAPTPVVEEGPPNLCPYSTGYMRMRGSVMNATSLAGNVGIEKYNSRYMVAIGRTNDYLATIDISDPDVPVIAWSGTSPNIDGANAVAVSGKYAFVVSNNVSRFVSYDLSNPTAVTQIQSLAAGASYLNTPDDIEISGDYAFVSAEGLDQISVFNITDPANMSVVTGFTHASMNAPRGMDIVGDRLYVTGLDSDSLVIIDISNPAAPAYLGNYTSATNIDQPLSVVVDGDYAYVGSLASPNIAVINISNPAAPVFVRSLTGTGISAPYSLTKVNDHLYSAQFGASTLTAIDVTGRTNPVIKDVLTDATNFNGSNASTFSGQYIVTTARDGNRVTVVDIGCDAQPVIDWRSAQKVSLSPTFTPAGGDDFGGGGISISGPYVAVGGRQEPSGNGYVQFFDSINGDLLRTLVAADGAVNDQFGLEVKFEGNHLLAGAPMDDDNGSASGSSYLYKPLSTSTQAAKFTGVGMAGGSQFGGGSDISGKYGAIGAWNFNSVRGAVFLYDLLEYMHLRTFQAPTPVANDEYGAAIAISNNKLVVGAPGRTSDAGALFTYDIGSGDLLHTIAGSAAEYLGSAISADNDLILASGAGGATSTGTSSVFDLTTGTEFYTMLPHDLATGDAFGLSTNDNAAISGKYAVIGAADHDTNGLANSGAAYIFDASSGYQIAKLTAPTVATSAGFGYATDIDNQIIGVTAPGTASGAGAAYLYYGSPTERQKSGMDCYPRPFDFFTGTKYVAPSSSITSNVVKIEGLTGPCRISVIPVNGVAAPTNITINVNGVPVAQPSTMVKNFDKVSITVTSDAARGEIDSYMVKLGDWQDKYDVITGRTMGYFMLSTNERLDSAVGGNMGGIEALNEKCLAAVNDHGWSHKTQAGPVLDPKEVRAFICDDVKCQNLLPSKTYTFSGHVSPGGATFTADANGLGPNDSVNWGGATQFNAGTGIATGRAAGSSTKWPNTPGNTCNGWTSSSAAVSYHWGQTNFTNDDRWNRGTTACDTVTHGYIVCMVHPNM